MPIRIEPRGIANAVSYYETIFPARLEVGTRNNLVQSSLNVMAMTRNRIGGSALRNITGRLRSSIQTGFQGGTLETYEASVFSDVIYAPVQEMGATIQAKRAYNRIPGGPYLNIPIPPNRQDSGIVLRTAGDVFREGGYIIRSRRGNWIVMLRGEPQFVLKKSVVIPPRLGMSHTAEDGFNAAERELPQLLVRLRNFPLE